MSIKNKFATAVATASLLAGLFGSAFVPSAAGVVITDASTVVARYTTLTAGSKMDQAGTAKSYGFVSDDSHDTTMGTSNDVDTYIDVTLFTSGSAGNGEDELDLTATNNVDTILKATSSNANVNVGWAYDKNQADALGEDTGDADILNDDADGFTDAIACGTANNLFGTTSSVKSVTGSDNDATPSGVFRLCLTAETATTAATSTITITWGGAVVSTFSVIAVGPVASLTASITDGYKYIAEDNGDKDGWFTIIAKDANGTQINGADSTVSNDPVDVYAWEDNPENKMEDMVDPFDGTSGGTSAGADGADIYYDLENDTCVAESGDGEEDGDAGTSYTIKFADAASDADVVSNAISITCTLNSDGARVTALTPEALTGARDYNEPNSGTDWFKKDDLLSLTATVVDADGRPLGDGADQVNFDWEITSGDSTLDATIGYDGATGRRVVRGGEFIAATLDPLVTRDGRFTYVITALDSDLDTDDDVEKAFTNRYTVGQSDGVLTRTRNAAKTVAVFRADMGEDAAYDIVTFFVELASGRVVEYDRLSNADGVATLTLAKRNTKIFVFADYLGVTNQVAARFR
jgi:hypothetical protein